MYHCFLEHSGKRDVHFCSVNGFVYSCTCNIKFVQLKCHFCISRSIIVHALSAALISVCGKGKVSRLCRSEMGIIS